MYDHWTPQPTTRQRQIQKQQAKKRCKQTLLTLGLCSLVFTSHSQAPDSFLSQHLPNFQESLQQLGTAFQQPTPLWQEVASFFQTLTTPLPQETPDYGSAILVFSPDMLKISTLEEYQQEQSLQELIDVSISNTDTALADSELFPSNSSENANSITYSDSSQNITSPEESSNTSDSSPSQDALAYFASPNWTMSSKLWSDLMEPKTDENQSPLPEIENSPSYPIGTILETNYTNLPNTHTEDYIYLGNKETTTPVLDIITSPYGGRTNPVTGNTEDIHNGVDIRGATGTPIYAWSDATVETVGETPFVGRYVRLDHGDNITTFYAHCNTVLVAEGEKINNGDIIALVGATGQVTGPHLHFEIRYGETYLNPLHYIDYTGFLD